MPKNLMDNLTITICLATTASHTLTTFNSTCLVKQSTENLDLMATKNCTTFYDFINVFEGQNTKNNGQRERNIGNRNYEQWKLNDCSTKAGSLKINTSSFL